MNWKSATLLTLLRVAIGWHLLVEGLDKLQSGTFSSEVYLRESTGPLSPYFRKLAGDPLAERLTPGPDKQPPARLAAEWKWYANRVADAYQFTPEQRQKADEVLNESLTKYVNWVEKGPKKSKLTGPDGSPPVEVESITPAERLRQYQDALAEAHAAEAGMVPYFGGAVYSSQMKPAKDRAAAIRKELTADVAEKSKEFRDAIDKILTAEQRKQPGPSDVEKQGWFYKSAKEIHVKMNPPADAAMKRGVWNWGLLEWTDQIVQWGLVITGLCLILGLFTKPACLFGAMLLLLFYLAMPPLPWLPDNPKAEGHYLFINKNVIEMIALLALATLPSGRWIGLDGLLSAIFVRRRKAVKPRS